MITTSLIFTTDLEWKR